MPTESSYKEADELVKREDKILAEGDKFGQDIFKACIEKQMDVAELETQFGARRIALIKSCGEFSEWVDATFGAKGIKELHEAVRSCESAYTKQIKFYGKKIKTKIPAYEKIMKRAEVRLAQDKLISEFVGLKKDITDALKKKTLCEVLFEFDKKINDVRRRFYQFEDANTKFGPFGKEFWAYSAEIGFSTTDNWLFGKTDKQLNFCLIQKLSSKLPKSKSVGDEISRMNRFIKPHDVTRCPAGLASVAKISKPKQVRSESARGQSFVATVGGTSQAPKRYKS